MNRRLVIHCGLHKTGTTALQRFIHVSADALRARGVLVPTTARLHEYGGGHHNVAWELLRDRRHDPGRGTVNELAEEIAAFDGNALISSEDFESCLAAPSRMAPLLRHPKLAGHRIELVAYLRDQISTAESIYLEKLDHGAAEECASVMHEVTSRGEWRLREWRFQFDYARLQRGAPGLAPARLLWRAYADIAEGDIVPDFFAFAFPRVAIAGIAPIGLRLNQRRGTLASLGKFQTFRVGHHLNARETAAIRLIVGSHAGAPTVLSPSWRRAFIARFAAGNAALCASTGLDPACLEMSPTLPPANTMPFMDWVYSFETQMAIGALARLIPTEMDPEHPDPDLLQPVAANLLRSITQAWMTVRPIL